MRNSENIGHIVLGTVLKFKFEFSNEINVANCNLNSNPLSMKIVDSRCFKKKVIRQFRKNVKNLVK